MKLSISEPILRRKEKELSDYFDNKVSEEIEKAALLRQLGDFNKETKLPK